MLWYFNIVTSVVIVPINSIILINSTLEGKNILQEVASGQ